jgi:hypothetical protein
VTKRKPSGPQVSTKLGKHIDKMLEEVMAGPKPPKDLKGEALAAWLKEHPPASLTDKMRVMDRALKYEAIKLKVPGSGEGGWFDGQEDGGEEE